MRLVVVFSISAASSVRAVPQTAAVGRVAWLQGCWEMQSPDRIVEEQWMAPRGKSMIGSVEPCAAAA